MAFISDSSDDEQTKARKRREFEREQKARSHQSIPSSGPGTSVHQGPPPAVSRASKEKLGPVGGVQQGGPPPRPAKQQSAAPPQDTSAVPGPTPYKGPAAQGRFDEKAHAAAKQRKPLAYVDSSDEDNKVEVPQRRKQMAFISDSSDDEQTKARKRREFEREQKARSHQSIPSSGPGAVSHQSIPSAGPGASVQRGPPPAFSDALRDRPSSVEGAQLKGAPPPVKPRVARGKEHGTQGDKSANVRQAGAPPRPEAQVAAIQPAPGRSGRVGKKEKKGKKKKSKQRKPLAYVDSSDEDNVVPVPSRGRSRDVFISDSSDDEQTRKRKRKEAQNSHVVRAAVSEDEDEMSSDDDGGAPPLPPKDGGVGSTNNFSAPPPAVPRRKDIPNDRRSNATEESHSRTSGGEPGTGGDGLRDDIARSLQARKRAMEYSDEDEDYGAPPPLPSKDGGRVSGVGAVSLGKRPSLPPKDYAGKNGESGSAPPLPPKDKDHHDDVVGEVVVGKLDYVAEESTELSLYPGLRITVEHKYENGWWVGTTSSGQRGTFPSNFVVPEGEAASLAGGAASAPRGGGVVDTAIESSTTAPATDYDLSYLEKIGGEHAAPDTNNQGSDEATAPVAGTNDGVEAREEQAEQAGDEGENGKRKKKSKRSRMKDKIRGKDKKGKKGKGAPSAGDGDTADPEPLEDGMEGNVAAGAEEEKSTSRVSKSKKDKKSGKKKRKGAGAGGNVGEPEGPSPMKDSQTSEGVSVDDLDRLLGSTTASGRRREFHTEDDEARIRGLISIVEAEREYLRGLKTILDEYAPPIKAFLADHKKSFANDQISPLLANIEVIYGYNHSLFIALEKRMLRYVEEWDSIPQVGDILLEMKDYMLIYKQYVNDYPKGVQFLETLSKKSSKWNAFLAEASEEGSSKPLPDLLLLPIKRIKVYITSIEEVLLVLPPSHADNDALFETMAIIREVEELIEAGKEDLGTAGDAMRVFGMLDPKPEGLIKSGRILVKEGDIFEFLNGKLRKKYFFLFSDVLVITRPKSSKKHKFEKLLALKGGAVDDRDDYDPQDWGFPKDAVAKLDGIFQLHALEYSGIFFAENKDEKTVWCSVMRHWIDKEEGFLEE